jgi:hypothetical protein
MKANMFIANVVEDLVCCGRKYKGNTFSRWDVESALWRALRALNVSRNPKWSYWFPDNQEVFVRNVLTQVALGSGCGVVSGYCVDDVKKAINQVIKESADEVQR